MKALAFLLLIQLMTAGMPSPAGSLLCYDGCSSIALSVGDYVKIMVEGEFTCDAACGSGTGIAYDFERSYVVQSIGSGCSGTPQGCVRICECP